MWTEWTLPSLMVVSICHTPTDSTRVSSVNTYWLFVASYLYWLSARGPRPRLSGGWSGGVPEICVAETVAMALVMGVLPLKSWNFRVTVEFFCKMLQGVTAGFAQAESLTIPERNPTK